ncbi:hypothetical protein NHX12_034094 [Muraenolepis orangiensis]|uniref:Uncharacterized protein n=1 Tax=Muraenolepis orangiensis TaxID=630683 RepID=A0A9Q0IIK4_9TELE|nr:hypothetical protein NHX12_034094 [Muraenolepis orangiensis]
MARVASERLSKFRAARDTERLCVITNPTPQRGRASQRLSSKLTVDAKHIKGRPVLSRGQLARVTAAIKCNGKSIERQCKNRDCICRLLLTVKLYPGRLQVG